MAVRLPTWDRVEAKKNAEEPLTALERFIYENEPAGTDHEKAFRSGLRKVVEEAHAMGREEALAAVDKLRKGFGG